MAARNPAIEEHWEKEKKYQGNSENYLKVLEDMEKRKES